MPTGLPNNSTIRWTEHVQATGPLEIDYTADDATVRRTIDLANFSDYDKAAQAFLGYGQVKSSPAGNKFIARFPPEVFYGAVAPDSVNPYLYAISVRVRGMSPKGSIEQGGARVDGGPTTNNRAWANYQQARLTVEYGALDWDIMTDMDMVANHYYLSVPKPGTSNPTQYIDDPNCPDESFLTRYVVRRVVPAAQYLSIRGNSFRYVPDGTFVTQGVGRMIVNCNLMLTWKNVPVDGIPCGFINPNVPLGAGAIESCLGCVNDGAVSNALPRLPSGLPPANAVFAGAAYGTLLLMAVEFKALRNRFGLRSYDVGYAFKFLGPGTENTTFSSPPIGTRIGHSHILRPTTNRWTQVSMTGSDNTTLQADSVSLYDYRNFRLLFRPP